MMRTTQERSDSPPRQSWRVNLACWKAGIISGALFNQRQRAARMDVPDGAGPRLMADRCARKGWQNGGAVTQHGPLTPSVLKQCLNTGALHGVMMDDQAKPGQYRKQYEQEWRPTEQERKASELAERYHHEAEAYDRTVCTGPVLHGSVMPADHRELAMVNGNAGRLRKQIMAEAAMHSISPQDMARAIGRHA